MRILIALLELFWMHVYVLERADNRSMIARGVLGHFSTSLNIMSAAFMRHESSLGLRFLYGGLIAKLSQAGLEDLDVAGSKFVRPFTTWRLQTIYNHPASFKFPTTGPSEMH